MNLLQDDAALVEWVRKNPDSKSQGKDLWVRAAGAKVTHHSWQLDMHGDAHVSGGFRMPEGILASVES